MYFLKFCIDVSDARVVSKNVVYVLGLVDKLTCDLNLSTFSLVVLYFFKFRVKITNFIQIRIVFNANADRTNTVTKVI